MSYFPGFGVKSPDPCKKSSFWGVFLVGGGAVD